jgi:hypothetical protein
MSLFCRHNRLTANCPICSRELDAELRAKAPARRQRSRAAAPGSPRERQRAASSGRSTSVVTRRVARAADDGYRNALAPGLRATADAERLGAALAAATERLEPPGPYPELALEPDREEATWLAFLLALAGPDAPELRAAVREGRPTWESGDAPELPAERARAVPAYRAWARRAGSQAAAFEGEPGWTPERRFARVFERLALPGFGRARRFDLLTALGAAGLYPLAAGELHVVEEDATTVAAKRLLVSGDRLLLERRARELAQACGVPIAALDRALAVWNTPGEHAELAGEIPGQIRAALALR